MDCLCVSPSTCTLPTVGLQLHNWAVSCTAFFIRLYSLVLMALCTA